MLQSGMIHLHRDDIMKPAMLVKSTRPVVCMSRPAVGTVNGHGYDGQQQQQKKLFVMIMDRAKQFKPVFHRFRLIGYLYTDCSDA